jgi:hypothetical protein
MKENNITAGLVKDLVLPNSILCDYLSRDLITVSSLAKELLPRIKEKNPKATVESISVAIHRLEFPKNESFEVQLKSVLKDVQITMKTGISLLCVKKDTSLPKVSDLSSDDTFFVNQGSEEITLILDSRHTDLISLKPIIKKDSLALLSLKNHLAAKSRYRELPGYVNLFLTQFARNGINVEDIVSTYGQVTFVFEEKDVLKAYELCKNIITNI